MSSRESLWFTLWPLRACTHGQCFQLDCSWWREQRLRQADFHQCLWSANSSSRNKTVWKGFCYLYDRKGKGGKSWKIYRSTNSESRQFHQIGVYAGKWMQEGQFREEYYEKLHNHICVSARRFGKSSCSCDSYTGQLSLSVHVEVGYMHIYIIFLFIMVFLFACIIFSCFWKGCVSWQRQFLCVIILGTFTTICNDMQLLKSKHQQKCFQDFCQSYMLSPDWIEIHQSQPLAWCKEGHEVTPVTVIGGFRSYLLITRKPDRNLGILFARVLISEISYQCSKNFTPHRNLKIN